MKRTNKKLDEVRFADFTPEDHQVVQEISNRAAGLYAEQGVSREKIDIYMDISATHVTCPLRLGDLLTAEGFDFVHDITGIDRHLDRTTGHLGNCFVPRYAQ